MDIPIVGAARGVGRRMLLNLLCADNDRQPTLVHASDLNWTLVRPGSRIAG